MSGGYWDDTNAASPESSGGACITAQLGHAKVRRRTARTQRAHHSCSAAALVGPAGCCLLAAGCSGRIWHRPNLQEQLALRARPTDASALPMRGTARALADRAACRSPRVIDGGAAALQVSNEHLELLEVDVSHDGTSFGMQPGKPLMLR
jgi:hypothetical protein